jgi:hypothetical protein
MLGPLDTENLTPLHFEALIDDSFTVTGLKAIALTGDITTVIAPGDVLSVGSCDNLEIKSVDYELNGNSILTIKPTNPTLSFTTDCLQADGVAVPVTIGSVLLTGTGVDHTVIVKSHTADLDKIEIVPESNWRGTSARLFFQPPSGLIPHTFNINNMDTNNKYIVRVSARNAEGYGPPSSTLEVTPKATVPSAPLDVAFLQ